MAKSLPKRVTMDDVAQLAGVSSQTVSRVVNQHPYVSDETRQRVMSAIQRLDYRPNRAARNLATQRTHMVGIITYGAQHYGPAQMMHYVEQTARARGYGVSFAAINTISFSEIGGVIHSFGERAVDGLVLITPIAGVHYAELVKFCGNIPFVQIDTELGAPVPSVVIDQKYGSFLAARHLISLGHRAICEISGPLNWHGAVARHQSWIDTLQEAGLAPGMSVEGDWTARSGYAAAQTLYNSAARFTAIVAGNDQMALGAIRALRERGVTVPDDVSIVGFDDIPEAAYFEPPLTTIRQDFTALGEQSVEYLIALIENPGLDIHQRVLHPELIQRQSAQAPDQSAPPKTHKPVP